MHNLYICILCVGPESWYLIMRRTQGQSQAAAERQVLTQVGKPFGMQEQLDWRIELQDALRRAFETIERS